MRKLELREPTALPPPAQQVMADVVAVVGLAKLWWARDLRPAVASQPRMTSRPGGDPGW